MSISLPILIVVSISLPILIVIGVIALGVIAGAISLGVWLWQRENNEDD